MAAPKNPAKKYSAETVALLLNTIRETGSLKTAQKAAGITKVTYYRWLRSYPPLVTQVSEAFDDYQRSVEPEHKEQARKAFEEYLYGKQKVVNTYVIERDEEYIDPQTGEKKIRKITENKTVTTKINTPKWAIERVLGKPLELSDAIATFQSFGYTVTVLDNGFSFIKTEDACEPSAAGENSEA